jgi:hypothetical protein
MTNIRPTKATPPTTWLISHSKWFPPGTFGCAGPISALLSEPAHSIEEASVPRNGSRDAGLTIRLSPSTACGRLHRTARRVISAAPNHASPSPDERKTLAAFSSLRSFIGSRTERTTAPIPFAAQSVLRSAPSKQCSTLLSVQDSSDYFFSKRSDKSLMIGTGTGASTLFHSRPNCSCDPRSSKPNLHRADATSARRQSVENLGGTTTLSARLPVVLAR